MYMLGETTLVDGCLSLAEAPDCHGRRDRRGVCGSVCGIVVNDTILCSCEQFLTTF